MRRLTPAESAEAARLYPSAVRLCHHHARRLGVDAYLADSAASLAAMDAAAGVGAIPSVSYRRTLEARRSEVPKSWRGKPRPLPLPASVPCPPVAPDRDDLVAAVAALPPKQWRAVELAILGGLGPARAARVLGVTKQAVQSRLRSATRTLRALLESPPCPHPTPTRPSPSPR